MPFSLEKSVTNILNSYTINNIFTNPVYISLLIVSIVMFIIYLIFKDHIDNTYFISDLFKAGIYMLLSIMGIIFIHNKLLLKEYEGSYENLLDRDTVQAGLTGTKKGSYEHEDIKAILSGAFKDSVDFNNTTNDKLN